MSLVNVFIGDSVTDCGREIAPPYGDGYVNEIASSGRLPGRIINVGTSGNHITGLPLLRVAERASRNSP